MGNAFAPFLARFAHHRPLLAPLTKAPNQALEALYAEVGVGWFKGNLIQILEPAIIDDLRNSIKPILRLQNKIPFAINALGDLFLWESNNSKIEFYDFSNNTLTKLADNIEDLLNSILYQLDFHPFLNAPLVNQLTKKFGPLTTSEIYKPHLPLILGGEKKLSNYEKSPFFAFIEVMVPIIIQWETLKLPSNLNIN